jgi:poly-gamma-glutamate capsule biosynthesis protein CapA/YwtB (metallophosphatase superfamily)
MRTFPAILGVMVFLLVFPWHVNAADSLRTEAPIVLRFAGDCLLADYYDRAVEEDCDHAFRNFSLLRDADIAMVNLECPITDRGVRQTKPFTFRMRPRCAPTIADAGIDIVNLANNHIYDFGRDGLFDTMMYLDSLGVQHTGAGRTAEEAHRGVIHDIRGVRLGFLGYYGGGEAPAAWGKNPGVADRNIAAISRDIKRMRREDSVQFIVVNFHWGVEKAQYPQPPQVSFARAVIDAGADAVIGHHPHVLQGIERYRNGVIVYSLGNFIFGGNSRASYSTALFQIRLTRHGAEYDVIPVGVDRWRATLLTGDGAESVLDHVRHLSARFPATIFHDKEKQ